MRRALAVLAAAGAFALSACGGDATPPSTTGTGDAGTAPTTAPASTAGAGITPEELGDRVGNLYLAAYEDLVALLSDRPEPAEAAPALADLKEQYVQQFVALGREREALDDAGRAAVDGRVNAALDRLPAATFEAYQQAFTHYAEDREVANLIAAFNVIGQYANFDLLRQQSPDEAARLGLG